MHHFSSTCYIFSLAMLFTCCCHGQETNGLLRRESRDDHAISTSGPSESPMTDGASVPDRIQSSSVSTSSLLAMTSASNRLHANDASSSADGCVIKYYKMQKWDWLPILGEDGPTMVRTTLSSILTNSAGTQITTLPVTVGAHKQSGTWTPLTTVKTLTFPTGYTQMPFGYIWYSTSGQKTGRYHDETLRTVFPYTSAISSLPPYVTGDPRGISWGLELTYDSPDPDQIKWLQSKYPDLLPLQECNVENILDSEVVPPGALVAMTLARPITIPSQTSTRSASAVLQDIWGTLDEHSSSTKPSWTQRNTINSQTLYPAVHTAGNTVPATASPAPVGFDGQTIPASTKQEHGTPLPNAIGHSMTFAGSESHDQLGSQISDPDTPVITRSGREYSLASSGAASIVNGPTSMELPKYDPTTTLIASHSGVYVLHGDITLSQGGPPRVVSETTYSALRSHFGIGVNGQNIPLTTGSTAAWQDINGLTVAPVNSGGVAVDGYTLDMSTTLTLGSGQHITRVALSTNNLGQTILLGDSITTLSSASVGPSTHVSRVLQVSSFSGQISILRSARKTAGSPTSHAPTKESLGVQNGRTSWWSITLSIVLLIMFTA